MTAARRRVLRWGLRVALVAVLIALVTVDARMKGGAGAGYVPGNATWVVYTPQFAQVWAELARTSTFRDFSKQWPTPYNKAQLHVRLTAGIRPTPLRWTTWLGGKAVVFGSDRGIGWCVRPGLLLRWAHAINAVVVERSDPDSFRYGPYHYAWRDGFVIFSTAPELVKAALAGREFQADGPVARDEVYVHWSAAPKGSLVIRAENGLPVRGAFESASQDVPQEFLPWPDEPFLKLDAASAEDFSFVAGFLRGRLAALPDWCHARDLIPESGAYITAAQQGGLLRESGLALYPPATKDSKTPESAFRFRFEEGAPAPPESLASLKAVGPFWYLAPDETRLQMLAAPSESAPEAAQALLLQVRWDKAGRVFENHLRKILDEDDSLQESIEGTGIPFAQALGTLGRLRIDGRHENGKLVFSGKVAEGVGKGQTTSSQVEPGI